MAKQAGNIKIEGRTFYRLVFYKMNGEYYARTKSSLTGKRVKKDPRFGATMRSAGLLARASKIGSAVYKALPKEFKQFWMYRAFTGEAMMMLKKGKIESEILDTLLKTYVTKEASVYKVENANGSKNSVKYLLQKGKKLQCQGMPGCNLLIGETGLMRYRHNNEPEPSNIKIEQVSIKRNRYFMRSRSHGPDCTSIGEYHIFIIPYFNNFPVN